MPDAANPSPPADPEAVAAAAVAAWEQANPALIAGQTAVREVLVADGLAIAPSDADLWGALPAEFKPSLEPATLAGLVGQAGYLVAQRSATQPWTARLAGCRAAVLPDRAVVIEADLDPIRRFVSSGGTLLAFGNASRLSPDGLRRNDYLLADLVGAHFEGLVTFDTESTHPTATADSIWAPQYPPENVIDGMADTFWASIEAGPMPHWVELAFPKPISIARADVACRPGFLIRDFEVQYKAGDEWRTAAKVAANEEWAIRCDFEKAVETSAVRLFVQREEMNGADRVIADVGEFTLYDATDRPIIAPPFLVSARLTDPTWAHENRADRLTLRSPAARIRSAAGKSLAVFADPLSQGDLPLGVQGKLGKGRACVFAVPEGALGADALLWESLLRAFVGQPVIRHSGDEGVLAFLSRGKTACLLHLVDTAPTDSPDRAKEAMVRVNTHALGPVGSALLVPEGRELDVSPHGDWVQLTAPLAPMASVLLRRAR